MPVDFSNTDDLPGSTPGESIFGTTPIYERAARRKRGWLKSSATPRAAAATTTTTSASRDFTATRASSSGARGGVPTWALVALPAAIVLGGGAYVLMQPRDPAEPAPMSVAAMDSATPGPPAAMAPIPELEPKPAATTAPPIPAAAPPARAERAPEPTRVARARPAPRAPAADEASADASATVPAPQPAMRQPNPLAVNPAPLVVPSVAQPPVTTDMAPTTPTAPAEVGGATQEVIPDAAAVPQ